MVCSVLSNGVLVCSQAGVWCVVNGVLVFSRAGVYCGVLANSAACCALDGRANELGERGARHLWDIMEEVQCKCESQKCVKVWCHPPWLGLGYDSGVVGQSRGSGPVVCSLGQSLLVPR